MTDNSRTNNKEEADMITVNLYYHPMNKELLMEDCQGFCRRNGIIRHSGGYPG